MKLLRGATLKRLIRTNALRKGLLGGHAGWRAVWFFLTLRGAWTRVSKKGPGPIAFAEEIPEGQAWTVAHVPERSRRGEGRGRRYGIGPRRRPPRVSRLLPPALAEAGRRIVEAPSADRINEILGHEVVTPPQPSRRERRRQKRADRAEAKRGSASA